MIYDQLKRTMTHGFGVIHGTNDHPKSFGAFIATMDINKVKAIKAVRLHCDDVKLLSRIDLLMVYGTFPKHIFFYRDGVVYAQVEFVPTQNVRHLEENPQLLYKRQGDGKLHNMRICAQQRRQCSNPVSGTEVNKTITLPER